MDLHMAKLVTRLREVVDGPGRVSAADEAARPALDAPALLTSEMREALGFSELAERQRQLLSRFGKAVLDVVCGSARPWEPRPRRALLGELLEAGPDQFSGVTYRQFSALLDDAKANGCLPGLSESPEGVFVIEENIAVKLERNKDAKLELARWAAGLVQSGQSVGLDGGSTTLPIATHLAQRMEDGLLVDLHVLTNSLSIAQVFSQLMVEQGWTDDGCPIQLQLAGGLLRANTHATAWEPTAEDGPTGHPFGIQSLDLCFLGANGFTRSSGLTMGADDELRFKRSVMQISSKPYFVADASKHGVVLPVSIATWDDPFTLVTNELDGADELDELALLGRIIEVAS
jgi:DeoR family fructose operon transcriptional repressor